jgi:hypothetical protein
VKLIFLVVLVGVNVCYGTLNFIAILLKMVPLSEQFHGDSVGKLRRVRLRFQ